MAKETRGIQLFRTETHGTSLNVFNRMNDTLVARVDVARLDVAALHRAAIHGITQNLMDSSNKLSGDERVAHVAQQAAIVQRGGWASAPSTVNVESAKAKMIAALVAKGRTADEAAALVESLGI